MKKFIFLAAVLLFFSGTLLAAAPSGIVLNFKDTLRIADEKNTDVLVSRQHLTQALERVTQARSYFFPDISGTISENRRTSNTETFGIPVISSTGGRSSPVVGPFNTFDARVHLTQTLFDVAMIQRFQAALAGGDMSRAELRKVREDVIALAGTLFVQARRAESRLEFSQEYLRLAAFRAKVMEQRLRLGSGSMTEAEGARADLAEARYLWRSASSDASAALLDLKTALGFSARQALSLSDDEIPGVSLPKAAEISESAAKHPNVTWQSARQKESQAEASAEKASFLPTVNGSADYGANGNNPDGSKATYFYGVEAVWDFFDFGRRWARMKEAESRVEETKTNFTHSLRDTEAKIYEARDAFKSARRYLAAKEDRWVYEKTMDESAKKKFENGSASRLEFVAASADLARAADEREEARSLYRIAEINLYHALGQMQTLLENKPS